jgi:hypothetical protein
VPLVTRLFLLVMAIVIAGCGGGQAAPATSRARGPRERSGLAARRDDRAPRSIIGTYAAHYDAPSGELRVEARFGAGASGRFGLDSGAEPFVRDFEVAGDTPDAKFTKAPQRGAVFIAEICARMPCRLRYRYALREAARKLEDVDVASQEGEVLQAPPSTWLLAPEDADLGSRVRFKVTCSAGTRFATGVYRSKEVEDAWDISLDDLATSPYSVFGPLRIQSVDVGGGTMEVARAPGSLVVTDEDILTWTKDSARAVTTYFGRFPMPGVLLILVPGRGLWIGDGKTLSGGGGSIFMRVGERAPLRAFREDWVLVHEMTHLAFPSVPRQHTWAEEGLATYVEPFARARAGTMSVDEAWLGLVEGLPNGQPRAGDRGLDRTPTWGRTYWGGAMFWLVADVEIRKRTQNRFGLEHALRGILATGANNAQRWALDDVLTVGDNAVGVNVLRDLHKQMGSDPHPVDSDALLASLGISHAKGRIRFDDNAPLAAIRRAITTPDRADK